MSEHCPRCGAYPLEPTCRDCGHPNFREREWYEMMLVRKVGDEIGYGRTMQLCEQLWREILGPLAGGEFGLHCCVGSLVQCPGCKPGAPCDWCCGSSRVTKRVAQAIINSEGKTHE